MTDLAITESFLGEVKPIRLGVVIKMLLKNEEKTKYKNKLITTV